MSKRTLYQHFTGKDELIAEHLRRFDPDILPEVFDRTDLTPRERLLAAFDIHPPLCPFIAAAVEIPDPGHPARVYARDYKQAFAARLTETAREAGATNPNSSASSWRCSWTAPRPAAESQHLNLLHRRRDRSSTDRQRHTHGSGTGRRKRRRAARPEKG